jgi:hypothetical protein
VRQEKIPEYVQGQSFLLHLERLRGVRRLGRPGLGRVVARAQVNPDRDVADEALLNHPADEFDVEGRTVSVLRRRIESARPAQSRASKD